MCTLRLFWTPYSISLFSSFSGQSLIAFTISFGESGPGSVLEAVICHCGNKWVAVFLSLKIIMELPFLLTRPDILGNYLSPLFIPYTIENAFTKPSWRTHLEHE